MARHAGIATTRFAGVVTRRRPAVVTATSYAWIWRVSRLLRAFRR